MARIVAIILLMVAAFPFAGFQAEARGATEPARVAAMDMQMDIQECNASLPACDHGLACVGMMLHCVGSLGVDHALFAPALPISGLGLRAAAVDAESLAPEASSPPPRA